MKLTIKTEIIPLLILIAVIISSFYFYPILPEQIAIHWNMAGEPDNWALKNTAIFLFPGIIIGMYILFLVLPMLDPKKERYNQFSKVYNIFKSLFIFFMAGIYFISNLNNIGYNISLEIWIPFLVGILFIVIGNYMGKIKSNWFVGIKTPWTLSSEEAWNKTHRFGGKIFIFSGLIMASMGFLPISWRMPLFIFIILLMLFGTFGYSYFIYSKEKKQNR